MAVVGVKATRTSPHHLQGTQLRWDLDSPPLFADRAPQSPPSSLECLSFHPKPTPPDPTCLPRPAANSNLHLLGGPITLGPFLHATSCFLTDNLGRGGAAHGGVGAAQSRYQDLSSATPKALAFFPQPRQMPAGN